MLLQLNVRKKEVKLRFFILWIRAKELPIRLATLSILGSPEPQKNSNSDARNPSSVIPQNDATIDVNCLF
jgi:hypothetical protein